MASRDFSVVSDGPRGRNEEQTGHPISGIYLCKVSSCGELSVDPQTRVAKQNEPGFHVVFLADFEDVVVNAS